MVHVLMEQMYCGPPRCEVCRAVVATCMRTQAWQTADAVCEHIQMSGLNVEGNFLFLNFKSDFNYTNMYLACDCKHTLRAGIPVQ
jgi:hypothetical protein